MMTSDMSTPPISIADSPSDSGPPSRSTTSTSASRGVTGLLGPNGAGKTTLLRIGRDGARARPRRRRRPRPRSAHRHGRLAIRRRLGYMPQEPGYHRGFTAFDFVDYVAILKERADRRRRHDEVRRVLDAVGLESSMHKRDPQAVRGHASPGRDRPGAARPARPARARRADGRARPGAAVAFPRAADLEAAGRRVLLSTHQTEDVAALCQRSSCSRRSVRFDGTPATSPELAMGRVWHRTNRDAPPLSPGAPARAGVRTSASRRPAPSWSSRRSRTATSCSPAGLRSKRRRDNAPSGPDAGGDRRHRQANIRADRRRAVAGRGNHARDPDRAGGRAVGSLFVEGRRCRAALGSPVDRGRRTRTDRRRRRPRSPIGRTNRARSAMAGRGRPRSCRGPRVVSSPWFGVGVAFPRAQRLVVRLGLGQGMTSRGASGSSSCQSSCTRWSGLRSSALITRSPGAVATRPRSCSGRAPRGEVDPDGGSTNSSPDGFRRLPYALFVLVSTVVLKYRVPDFSGRFDGRAVADVLAAVVLALGGPRRCRTRPVDPVATRSAHPWPRSCP